MQLALGWQIAKQLSGLNTLLLSYKNPRLKESGVNTRKISVKLTIHQNSVVSKASILNPENYSILQRHRLLGQTVKHQPLSKSEPRKP